MLGGEDVTGGGGGSGGPICSVLTFKSLDTPWMKRCPFLLRLISFVLIKGANLHGNDVLFTLLLEVLDTSRF